MVAYGKFHKLTEEPIGILVRCRLREVVAYGKFHKLTEEPIGILVRCRLREVVAQGGSTVTDVASVSSQSEHFFALAKG